MAYLKFLSGALLIGGLLLIGWALMPTEKTDVG